MTLVSAVIANWNGAHYLKTCIPSLLEQSYRPLEIIVVDNDSTDDSEDVARRYGVRWLALEKNLGLAPALNRGAQVATGEFVLFLNNDMRFERGFVESLAEVLAQDENVFAVDGLQYDWEGKRKVHLATFLAKHPYRDRINIQVAPGLWTVQKDVKEPTVVFQACAAAMMVRKKLFLELGGLDERMPLSYEDTDLCWRAWMRGWRTVFVPSAVCYHKVGGSSEVGEGRRLRFRGTLKGKLVWVTKLLPWAYVLTTIGRFVLGTARDFGQIRGGWRRERIGVLRDYVRDLGALLQERRQLYRHVRTTPTRHLRQLLNLMHEN